MPETPIVAFTYKEVAEALVKFNNLHEGHWGIYVEFGIGGANISQDPGGQNMMPAAIIPINKIGIQRFPQPNSLTVDAAVVNPTVVEKPS